jgi:hypothetical protein
MRNETNTYLFYKRPLFGFNTMQQGAYYNLYLVNLVFSLLYQLQTENYD